MPEIPLRKPVETSKNEEKAAEEKEKVPEKLNQGRGVAFNLDVKNRFARLRNIEKELEEEEERER